MVVDKKTLELEIKILAEKAASTVTSLSGNIKQLALNAKGFTGDAVKVNETVTRMESVARNAATSIKLFGANTIDLKNAQAQIKSTVLDLVNNGLDPENESVKGLIEEYKKLGTESDNLETSQKGLMGVIEQAKNQIGSLAAVAGAVKFNKAIIGLGGFALETADTFKTAREEFGVMLQDMEAGAALFDTIIKPFNDLTPFDLDTTKQATIGLKTAGIEIQNLTTWLTRMGDLSQGNSQRMTSYVSAFSKASAKGKADMEVLNIYIDQGVPIIQALADHFDVAKESVIQMASDGKISSQDFMDTLEELTSQGGQYYGGMELASKRYKSMQEGLNESVNSLASSFGEMLLPAGIKVIDFFTKMVNVINGSPFLKGTLAAALTVVTAAINIMAFSALKGLILQLWKTYAATMAVATAKAALNPVMLGVVAAVAAGVAVYTVYAAKQQEVEKNSNANALALLNEKNALDELKQKALDYSTTLDGISNKQLVSIAETYTEYFVPAALRELENAQAILKNTPFTIKGRINPEYELAENAVEKAQQYYNDELARLEGVQIKLKEVQEETKKAIASFGTDWQDKNLTGLEKIIREREKAVEELKEKVEKLGLGDSFLNSDAYKAELNALMRYFQKQIDDFNKNNKLSTKWQDKDVSGIDKIIQEREKAIEELKGEVEKLGLGDSFLNSNEYKAEFNALMSYFQTQIDDFNKNNKLSTEWTDKELTGVNALNDQRYKAYQKLRDEALKIYGDEYTTQAEYQTQLYSMNKHYDEEIAKFNKEEADKLAAQAVEEAQKERNRIKELSQKRKDAYLEEAQYRQALAAQSMESAQNPKDYFSAAGDYAAQSFKTAIADTDFGSLLSGAGDPMTMFIDATIKAAMEVESLNKVLNFASTIVDKMFSSGLGDSLDRMFSDKARELESYGTSFGQILSFAVNALSGLLFVLKLMNPGFMILEGALKLAGNSFEWLNNRVIVPVGNGFIRAINAIITEINKLPGIDIPKIKQLSVIGELAEEIAKELEKQQNAIKESFERQKQTIDDTLRSQIDSIQSQYELGLITRAQYEASASSYMDAASTARTQIEDQMNSALEALAEAAEGASSIDELTAPKPTGSLWDQISTSIKDGFKNSFNGIKEDFLTKFTGIKDKAAGYFDGIKDKAASYFDGVKDKAASFFSGIGDSVAAFFKKPLNGIITAINKIPGVNVPLLAVGTTNIPRDMLAYVHQGEGVFPKTFMEGIRNNEIAIVGPEFTSPSQGRSGGNYFMVSIHVEGSVVTERKLIDVVYDGLAGVIGSGEKTALPAGAY